MWRAPLHPLLLSAAVAWAVLISLISSISSWRIPFRSIERLQINNGCYGRSSGCCRDSFLSLSVAQSSNALDYSSSEDVITSNSSNNTIDNSQDIGDSTAQMNTLIEYLVDSVNQGKTEELIRRGFKVTSLSPHSSIESITGNTLLDANLMDPEVQEDILGPNDEEDLEMLRLLEDGKQWVMDNTNQMSLTGTGDGSGPLLLDDIREIISLELDDIDPILIGELQAQAKQAMSALCSSDDSLSTTSATITSSEEGDTAPTSSSTSIVEDDINVSAAAAGTDVTRSIKNEAVFAELLKATITDIDAKSSSEVSVSPASDDTEVVSPLDPALVENTLSAIQEDRYRQLDIKSIIGEALYSLTSTLGIDVEEELSQSGQAQLDLKNIMSGSMSDLAVSMADLEAESLQLFDRLEALKGELRTETEEFEAVKQLELDSLLATQSELKGEYDQSQKYMRDSTERLAKVLRDLDEEADIITSLALFRMRSIDKKIAFIVGLSLLLKVPYDAASLVGLRSLDFTDWFSVFTQSGLCLACFNHYGLLRAIAVSTMNSRKEA